MSVSRVVVLVFGAALALVSLTVVVMCARELVVGSNDASGNLGALVFCLGTAIGGGFMVRAASRTRPKLAAMEQRILGFAASSGGRVTDLEVAARCNMTLADSRAALERLVGQGAAEIFVTPQGATVYAFAGFLSPFEKAAAVDILDSPASPRVRIDATGPEESDAQSPGSAPAGQRKLHRD